MKNLLLLAALAVGFYWKLTLTREFTFLDSPDTAYMTLPWYQFQAQAFHRGEFPLWDPHQWCGQPVVGQMQPGAAFPFNWPLFLAPLDGGRLNLDFFHWHFVAMHWLAAVFMYLYCRELGRGQLASVLAGCAFSFGGFIGSTTWPQVMNGALWMPLIFLFYHRAERARSGRASLAAAAGCGGAVGLALLAGHHQAPLLEVLALSAVFLFDFLTSADRWRRMRLFAVTAVFAAAVGAFLLLPAFEYGSRTYRWVNLPEPVRFDQTVPYAAQEGQGLMPMRLLGLVAAVEGESANPFVGLVSVALALIGAAACWQTRAVRRHACLALAGLAYALGSYSVFQGVLYAVVPFLNKGRSPGYAVLILQFGLLVVAAHGADALLDAGAWQRRLVRGLLLFASVAGAAQVLLAAGANPAPHRAGALIIAALVAVMLAALVHAASGGHLSSRAAQAGIVALLLVELYAATAPVILPRTNRERPNSLDRHAQHRGVIEFLRGQPAPFRVHADEQEIPYNFGDWHELDASAGYLATISADLYDFIGLDWAKTALMLNQVYVVGREKSRPEQEEVFAEPGGLKVFRNPDAYPRAWLVGNVRVAADRPAAVGLMQSAEFDPRRETFLLGGSQAAPQLERCADQGTIEWVAREIHRVAVRVRSGCGQMIVFGDPLLPGWQARLDGPPVEIYAAYGALRGVVVPAGERLVELRYRPRSVYLGAVLSAGGLLGWLLLALGAWRESRRSRVPGGP